MDNLKTRETFWFTENAKEISRDLAEGNADAERAMFLVFSRIDGVRAYLHCSRLTFSHPMTGEAVCVTAPLPQDIKAFL